MVAGNILTATIGLGWRFWRGLCSTTSSRRRGRRTRIREVGVSEKEEVVDKKAATSRGRSHISAGVRFVGFVGQAKM